MITIARILATVFALIVLSRSIVDYKDKKESLQMTIFWVMVWLAIATIAFFPSIVDAGIRMFGGDKSGLGTIFGMGLVFVLFISYRIYIKANRNEKTVNELSRIISLWDIGKKTKRKNGQISKK